LAACFSPLTGTPRLLKARDDVALCHGYFSGNA
jgi:hypothetical protein